MRKPDCLDLNEVLAAVQGDTLEGFCVECGAARDGCEPDARRYKCVDCGALAVYGAEELLLMYGGAF